MDQPELLINSVFHPSDFSEGDETAFAHALKIAHALSAELCLMHVREPMEKSYWADFPHVRNTLKHWGADADALCRLAVVVVTDDAAHDAAQNGAAELIVGKQLGLGPAGQQQHQGKQRDSFHGNHMNGTSPARPYSRRGKIAS